MKSQGRFQLHMPGLLKVLAEHLYSTQRVGVRELIQNAHDSCVRRGFEHQDADYQPRIDLTFDKASQTLCVSDNGSGLTESEIHSYLTVIGRGYTRELRERLAADELQTSQALIGQFGIGFLSAFLLASSVTVQTRSLNGPSLCWQSHGDETFEMTAGDQDEFGTTVELRLKPSVLFLLNEQNLIDVVHQYADFVPTPIHVQKAVVQANLGRPPWDEADAATACRDYVKRRFGEANPLWVMPLVNGTVNLGHDTMTIPLRGFLFIPAESTVSIKEYGKTAVYIRGMAICDGDKDLLPSWARFVQGVIDCPALQPTASREAVHQDDSFDSVREVIADQLERGLRALSAHQPETWRKIAYGHSDVIVGWACKDRGFFRMVADSVPLKTSRGRLTLPQYLKLTGHAVYFTTRELGSLQDKILAEGRDVPAIDASWFAVPAFLNRYAELHPETTLVRLDDEVDLLLRPAPSGPFEELMALGEELGFCIRVASFHPSDVPAVMTYPAEAETVRDAMSALDENLIPDGFSGLVQGYVDQRRTISADTGTLHLNAANPLIRRLADSTVPTGRKQAALAVIAYFAKLFCGRMLDASQATSDIGSWQRSLDRLI
ncbi:MAG: ATP-binding protein [Planctomycetes bacterium]|nr:ATP-binding protein [Planctomycetota bacterium]